MVKRKKSKKTQGFGAPHPQDFSLFYNLLIFFIIFACVSQVLLTFRIVPELILLLVINTGTMDNSSIKNNILSFRKKRKYTQEHVANMLGISVTAYRELERGNTSIVNPNILRMASLMNASTEELVLGYHPTETEGLRLKEVQEEYGSKVENLETKIKNLEKLVSSLEETVASKNEIISMLKKMLAEQK